MKLAKQSYYKGVLAVLAGALTASAPAFCNGAEAALRIANKADFLSLDPHSFGESLQLDVLGNVYESLTTHDQHGKLAPALATRWEQVSEKVWRFHLRKGVKFHDGQAFSADDVLFSYRRAGNAQSGIHAFVGAIQGVDKIDSHTVDFKLKEAQPNFPESIRFWYMLNEAWCKSQSCDFAKGDSAAFITTHANGTGPYRLVERVAGDHSAFRYHDGYWGRLKKPFKSITFSTIADDQKRVNALLQKNADIVDPYPVKMLDKIKSEPQFRVISKPEDRVIFLGYDIGRSELLYSGVKGANPFRDLRVRQAMMHAINLDEIHEKVMNGASKNIALLIPPAIFGYDKSLDSRPQYDLAKAKGLMRDAGYADGFSVRLNCPNDRYINDAEICRAVADQLAAIGIRVELDIETKSKFFAKVLNRDTSFYLLGAATNTGDAFNVLFPVIGTPGGEDRGKLNLGGYSNPEIDKLLAAAENEADKPKRLALFKEVMQRHQQDVANIPLHQQYLLWAARADIDLHITSENGLPWKFVKRK